MSAILAGDFFPQLLHLVGELTDLPCQASHSLNDLLNCGIWSRAGIEHPIALNFLGLGFLDFGLLGLLLLLVLLELLGLLLLLDLDLFELLELFALDLLDPVFGYLWKILIEEILQRGFANLEVWILGGRKI